MHAAFDLHAPGHVLAFAKDGSLAFSDKLTAGVVLSVWCYACLGPLLRCEPGDRLSGRFSV